MFDLGQYERDQWVAEQARLLPAGARVLDVGPGSCRSAAAFAHCDYRSQEGMMAVHKFPRVLSTVTGSQNLFFHPLEYPEYTWNSFALSRLGGAPIMRQAFAVRMVFSLRCSQAFVLYQ